MNLNQGSNGPLVVHLEFLVSIESSIVVDKTFTDLCAMQFQLVAHEVSARRSSPSHIYIYIYFEKMVYGPEKFENLCSRGWNFQKAFILHDILYVDTFWTFASTLFFCYVGVTSYNSCVNPTGLHYLWLLCVHMLTVMLKTKNKIKSEVY